MSESTPEQPETRGSAAPPLLGERVYVLNSRQSLEPQRQQLALPDSIQGPLCEACYRETPEWIAANVEELNYEMRHDNEQAGRSGLAFTHG